MKMQTVLAAVFCMLWPVGKTHADINKIECQTCVMQQRVAELQAKVDELQQKVDFNEIKDVYFKILLEKQWYGGISSSNAWTYAEHVVHYAKEYNNNVDNVLSIIFVESNFNQWDVSPVGAQGAMQIMPHWKRDSECGTPDGKENYFNLETNIKRGNCILAKYRKIFNNNFVLAAIAYNKGPETVKWELKHGIDPSNDYDYKILKELRRLKRWQSPFNQPLPPTDQTLAQR